MVTTAIQAALQRHDNLKAVLEKYPCQAPSLSQMLVDLTHASKWQHLCIVDTAAPGGKEKGVKCKEEGLQLGRALVIGLRPEAKGLEAVWSCEISDMLNSAIFHEIFAALDDLDISVDTEGKQYSLLRTHFLIAVHSPDASIVYYNMARGLVKPIN